MKRPPRKTSKKYWEMTTDELAEATREFDREFVVDESRPLSPKMAARWRRAKRGTATSDSPGSRITIQLKPNILRRADRLAKRLDVSRARLIEMGLLEILARQGAA